MDSHYESDRGLGIASILVSGEVETLMIGGLNEVQEWSQSQETRILEVFALKTQVILL